MKTIVLIGFLLMTFAGGVQAQTPPGADLLKFRFVVTNTFPAASSVTGNPVIYADKNIPLIIFGDVPITTAIENLARQAGINYILEPDLFPATDDNGHFVSEPLVTCRWKNINARDALDRICDEHDLKLVKNPAVPIVHITRPGHPKNFIDVTLLGLDTNAPASTSEKTVPLIQFSEVPLDIALVNLLKQCTVPVELDSNLMENVSQFIETNHAVVFDFKLKFGGKPRDKWFDPMPFISARWESITTEEAIVALCENYDLDIIKNDTTGNLQITPRKIKRHHRLKHY